MTAEIVSVGTEILMGQIADTNARHLGRLLPELGISHLYRQTVGDNLERLTGALKLALSRSDIVFTIGGLGPTQDDLTRDGIAAALDSPLIVDDNMAEKLRRLFAQRNLPWLDSQLRQAMRPECARLIDNPNGTAPGLACEEDGKLVIAMPGPRGEFVPMVDGPVREILVRFCGAEEVIHSRLLRICGMGESMVEDKVKPLLDSSNPTVAPYAKVGEVHLRISARAPNIELAEAMIAPVEQRIRSVLADAVYGSGETTLEAAVVDLMRARNLKLAVAESISGGGLGHRITNVAGSGDVFIGGIISYNKEVKTSLLGVDQALLDDPKTGPVSTEVAEQMAVNARRLFKADLAVSLTGNAGPTSDEGGKPVGLVYIAVAGPTGAAVQEHKFRGLREDIRARAIQFALTLLRKVVLEMPE